MCENIQNLCSGFEGTISGAPQGSIAQPVLFNVFLDYFLYFMENTSIEILQLQYNGFPMIVDF